MLMFGLLLGVLCGWVMRSLLCSWVRARQFVGCLLVVLGDVVCLGYYDGVVVVVCVGYVFIRGLVVFLLLVVE